MLVALVSQYSLAWYNPKDALRKFTTQETKVTTKSINFRLVIVKVLFKLTQQVVFKEYSS